MRPNGAVPRHITTVLYYDVIPHTHFRQHFNPISSPKRTVRHAWATLPRLSVARKHLGRPFREQNTPFRSRDNRVRPFREQNALSRSRGNLGRPFREQNAPFRSRDNLGRPSREQNTPSRSRDILGRPSREQIAAFHSRDILGRPFREQNAPSHSRDNLGRPFREQNTPFRSRDALADHFVSRTRRSAHETAAKDTRGNRGTFSASYGNSMETLRALYDAAEVRPEPVGLVIGLSAFRNRHLDG